MKDSVFRQARRYLRMHRQKKRWLGIAGILSAVVLFGTIHWMILPAITMGKTCQLEEHQHTEACYAQPSGQRTLVCSLESLHLHQHDADCYDETGALCCGYADFVLHSHTADCYDKSGALCCPLPEIEAHRHTEACYADAEGQPVCGQTERVPHTHEPGCYDETGVLICGQLQLTEHQHTEACFEQFQDEQAPVLICGKQEHTHSADCGAGEEEPPAADDAEEPAEDTAESVTITAGQTGGYSFTVGETQGTGGWYYLYAPVGSNELKEQAQYVNDCWWVAKNELSTGMIRQGAMHPGSENDAVIGFQAPQSGKVSISFQNGGVRTEAAAGYDGADGVKFGIYKKSAETVTTVYSTVVSPDDQIHSIAPIEVSVQEGDMLLFRVNKNASLSYDTLLCTPVVTYLSTDGGNTGTIRDTLDGDWAYITDFSMSADGLRTGTAPWDGDDEAGNDSTDLNDTLRTFDTASYTVQFSTKLREAIARQDVGGIRTGRLYFEFVLPCSAEEARFETDQMGWLTSAQDIAYEITTQDVTLDGVTTTCQILRGSFTLVPTGSNEAAIGGSVNELNIVLRAMKMHNGETIQPYFTLWLQHNDVGASYNETDARLPSSVVTGTTYVCPAPDEYETHGVEAQTVTAPAIKISARPMFNIEMTGVSANNTTLGTFDFNDADPTAINYGRGSVKGRMNGYGIVLETHGKTGQGMRGMEFPDTTQPITFDLRLSSDFQPENGTRENAEGYQPLFWAGDSNNGVSKCGERAVATKNLEICEIPAGEGNSYHNVKKLGQWSFAATSDPSVIHVTVTGLDFGPKFPSGGYGIQDTYYKYYNPTTVGENWWQIDRAVFGVGRVFVVQPFYDANGLYVCNKYGANGQFYTSVSDEHMTMYAQSVDGPRQVTEQEVTDDDVRNQGQYLKRPGNIDGFVQYNKYNGQYFEPVSAGAFQNDSDWATAGSKIMLQIEMEHDNTEGDYVGVACDNFLKWDDTFFEPEAEGFHKPDDVPEATVLWGAKPDGTGWTDDEEMKRCTEDDLIYFKTLEELEAAGYIPVGILFESRTVLSEGGYNHLHYFLNGKIKEDCPTGEVYMIVRNSYAWRKMDVADAALAYYNARHPDAPKANTDQLTNDDYNDYTKNALISHAPGSQNEGKYYANGGTQLNGSYPKPFWYHDYNHTSVRGSAEKPGADLVSECAAATKASYPGGVYQSGYGSLYYQDSCLVIGFTTSIKKQTAQSEKATPGTPKQNYDMDQNQRTVDYRLDVRVDRGTYTSDSSTGSSLKTVVYVEDTLPQELTYIAGTARLGGTYTQDDLHQNPGTVTGGGIFEFTGDAGVNLPTDAHPYLETVTYQADGTTTIRWMFPVEIDLNSTYWESPIRFSCQIGTPGVEATDVKHGQQIVNTAKVWADGDEQRSFSLDFGNMSTSAITVSKMNAVSLSKISDLLVGETWDGLGFTMNVGNNSANTKYNTIIAETLPYNGVNRSVFHGKLTVYEFSMAVLDASGTPRSNNFQFYYTTDKTYAGKLGSDYQAILEEYQTQHPGAALTDWMEAKGWTSLTFDTQTSETAGMPLYHANNLPDLTGETQITAIVAVGDLPANHTMKLHITLHLPNGEAGDYLVNYLSQDKLSSYARTQVVSRSLEGLTWWDENGDGLQNEADEKRMNGVKVSLYWLKDGKYVPYCYQGTETPVSVETGKTVDLLTENETTYEQGRYKFTHLPAGTFAVRFESGQKDISRLLASPENRGGQDDTIDSDGVPTYTDDHSKLEYTWIDGIEMTPAQELTYGSEESKYHDSGFYVRGAELPETGGTGTTLYTAGGLLLITAAFVLLHSDSKRRREGRKPS